MSDFVSLPTTELTLSRGVLVQLGLPETRRVFGDTYTPATEKAYARKLGPLTLRVDWVNTGKRHL